MNAKPRTKGLAQVRGYRGATPKIATMAQRVNSDIEYVNSVSVKLDIKILIKTAYAVLRRTNAY
jgi:lipopolysaccharide/colanic/teichoic acid biosynthesis glycosyltransferase